MMKLVVLFFAIFSTSVQPGLAADNTTSEPNLKKVPSHEVCMVNDQHFGKQQIPVEVSGKTYYGCCAMCKATLNKDSSVRQAVDPVTNETVDKAEAVIGAKPDGTVLYFETAKNLEKFNAG